MKKYVLVTLALLTLVQSSDAANRRRMRRQSRRAASSVTYAQPTAFSQPTASDYRVSASSQPGMIYTQPMPSHGLAPVNSTSTAMQQPIRVTYQKPVVESVDSNSVLLAQGDLPEVTDETTVDGSTIYQPVPVGTATGEPYCASCQVLAPDASPSYSALSELNAIRASRGLHPLAEDPALTALAFRKASIQANRGVMYHPGGSMGGARFEGVGMGARFTSCYQDSRAGTVAGAATVTGRNGQRFHCLLLR